MKIRKFNESFDEDIESITSEQFTNSLITDVNIIRNSRESKDVYNLKDSNFNKLEVFGDIRKTISMNNAKPFYCFYISNVDKSYTEGKEYSIIITELKDDYVGYIVSFYLCPNRKNLKDWSICNNVPNWRDLMNFEARFYYKVDNTYKSGIDNFNNKLIKLIEKYLSIRNEIFDQINNIELSGNKLDDYLDFIDKSEKLWNDIVKNIGTII